MKSIKTSLFVAAALAVALSFASCSNDTQDVHITNREIYYKNVGFMSASSMVSTSSVAGSGYTYSVDSSRLASVSYGKSEDAVSNTEYYELTVPYTSTYGSTFDAQSPLKITLLKVGDKYYSSYNNKDSVITVEGSLEDDEFTIASITTNGYTFTGLKFKKAE